MRVLILGGGGRERALAWACSRAGHEVTVAAELEPGDWDLVVPGSETFLADGVADECAARGIPCFGPTAMLAQLETSKAYARAIADRLSIPGPRWARFEDGEIDAAIAWWQELGGPVVVKLDGLAGGKGVAVPTSPAETVAAIEATAGPFVVEEQMSGPECSLLVICGGRDTVPLPIAQDHKRVGDGDTGPNTGGMGAFAPAPVAYSAAELTATFVQPVLDHFAAQSSPFVGVLYAGLMLTPAGPRLVEYNVRFGDPETQAIVPLLDGDLAVVMHAAATGTLGVVAQLRVSARAACTVVAAASGYPAAAEVGGQVTVDGWAGRFDRAFSLADAVVFPAAVTPDGLVAGGRVLAVTGVGDDLGSARVNAYTALRERVRFDGMHHRSDIGWRAPGALVTSYAAAGVDIDEGTRAVEQMKAAVQATHGPAVVAGVGSFGGAISVKALKDFDDPVLVASTDGVGTKVELAAQLGRYRGVGHDIVNHCINDVLVQSARPLFFLDYVASSRIRADMVAEVVTGMAEACAAAGCVLLGGETAEMPGVYQPGAFDIAGTLVGVAERSALLPRADVAAGDVLIGVASNGPHTNGYSLLRKVFQWAALDATPAGFDCTLADALLLPHRSYLDVLTAALGTGVVKALAHITGGGLPDNVPRVLPSGTGADVRLGSWPMPPLFALVRDLLTSMPVDELYRTLNMGIGMVVVCAPSDVRTVQSSIDEDTWVIGSVVAGNGVRLLTA